MKTCRDVAFLIASDGLKRQTRSVRWGVALHLWMCRHCSRLARQLQQIRQLSRHRFDDEAPADLEARIVQRLTKS